MTTIQEQLESVTNDYFTIEDGKAQDNYFETCFLLDYFLKQKKGMYKTPTGGNQIRVPIRYDGNKAAFFTRGEVLDSTKREAITEVHFAWKFCYGNGTLLWVDQLKNSGPEAMIDLANEELEGAQGSITDLLATSFYIGLEGDAGNLTGINSITSGTSTDKYGGYAEDDIVSDDGTKVWAGKSSSTSTGLTLDQIRTMKTAAAYGKGKNLEPDLASTTETLYNKIRSILTVQQQFTAGVKTAKVGFDGVHFEGTDIFPDRYCPSGNMALLNTKHIGFHVHKTKGYFKRTKWEKIQNTPGDMTMKILFAGNLVANNRRAHYRHSALS